MINEVAGNQIRVMVVDDDPDLCEFVSELIASWGFATLEMPDGSEALKVLEQNNIDIVVSDIYMPEMDGITLLKKINKHNISCLVILLTGKSDKEIIIEALRANAFDYLEKPVDEERLMTSLNRAVKFLTVQQQMEEKEGLLQEISRLSSIGEISTDIANQLSQSLDEIDKLTAKFNSLVEVRELGFKEVFNAVTEIKKKTRTMAEIIQSFTNLASKSQMSFETVSLNQLINEILFINKQNFKANQVKVTFLEAPGDVKFECDVGGISQVLHNLFDNACNAVAKLNERWMAVTAMKKNNLVRIEVTDSGFGIPTMVREDIFKPFYSTKEMNKGSGIGLGLSKKIVEAHGGIIYIKENRNTTFVVDLPFKRI